MDGAIKPGTSKNLFFLFDLSFNSSHPKNRDQRQKRGLGGGDG